MIDEKLKKIGFVFWLLITLAITFVFAFYFYSEQQYSLLVLAFGPFLGFLGYILGSRVKEKQHYYPTNLIEYTVENILFLLLFLLSIFYLKNYLTVKIMLFIIMTSVGLFSTYSIVKVYSSSSK